MKFADNVEYTNYLYGKNSYTVKFTVIRKSDGEKLYQEYTVFAYSSGQAIDLAKHAAYTDGYTVWMALGYTEN